MARPVSPLTPRQAEAIRQKYEAFIVEVPPRLKAELAADSASGLSKDGQVLTAESDAVRATSALAARTQTARRQLVCLGLGGVLTGWRPGGRRIGARCWRGRSTQTSCWSR